MLSCYVYAFDLFGNITKGDDIQSDVSIFIISDEKRGIREGLI